MITAIEARRISGETVEECAEFFSKHILTAANAKQRQVTVYHGKLEDEAYSGTDYWNSFVKYMSSLGYEVSLFYEERQFVDMRITIKW